MPWKSKKINQTQKILFAVNILLPMKATATVKKRLHQVCDPCFLYFFVYTTHTTKDISFV